MNKKRQLGTRELPPIGLGCMGMSEFYGESDHLASLKTLHQAYEYGYQHFDTADMYGRGKNETLIGEFIQELGSQERENLFISTKAGIVRDPNDQFTVSVNSSYNYIMQCCENSLNRLGVDYLDLFYLHRLSPDVPIEEPLRVLDDLIKQGVIKNVGLCEVNAETIRDAHRILPITAVQSEYSLWTRDVEENVLNTCYDLDIAFVAFSPLGRGFLTGNIDKDTIDNGLTENDFRKRIPRFNDENIIKNKRTLQTLIEISEELGKPPAQIALAWTLSKQNNIHVIPGTRRIKYMKQNFDSLNIALPSHITAKLDFIFLPENIFGERYPSAVSRHSVD
ncbi:aldo/keto reductase [Gammaproteobacteria bacterium 42_54_T18]|nr:aldo/keto reductase [Gammaproteobacteria bacterium 42_54_T18]